MTVRTIVWMIVEMSPTDNETTGGTAVELSVAGRPGVSVTGAAPPGARLDVVIVSVVTWGMKAVVA